MSEYNLRQFTLMKKFIDDFDYTLPNLGVLISKLDGLIGTLEEKTDNNLSTLRKKWGVLEDVYAISLDEKLEFMPNDYAEILQKALLEIREIVKSNEAEEIQRPH